MGVSCSRASRTTAASTTSTMAAAVVAIQALPESEDSLGSLRASKETVTRVNRRRISVSAEATEDTTLATSFSLQTIIPKSEDAVVRIKASMKHSFLFAELEAEQEQVVINSMLEREVEPDDVIISEGDEGDNFYIIENGTFQALKKDKPVFTYEGTGAFGELALMYMTPRLATVKALTTGLLWYIDRQTFRSLVLRSMAERCTRYEKILDRMEIFEQLSPEKKSQIANCLASEHFSDGDVILTEGEKLTSNAKFYLIDSGTINCYKTFEGGRVLVKSLQAGDFFGEWALVEDKPRQADCIAVGKVDVLTMQRDAFERLMGTLERPVLEAKIAEYTEINRVASQTTISSCNIQGDFLNRMALNDDPATEP